MANRLSILFLLCLLAFSSCKRAEEKQQITGMVDEWMNKEILFPSDSKFTSMGKDVPSLLKDWNYAVVSYVDSSGCTACKMQLDGWKVWMNKEKALFDKTNTVFLFYVQARDYKEFVSTLKEYNFDYPVCIDMDDSLNKLNHFSTDDAYRTFLLDKNRRVIALGNPNFNLKVRRLYTNIIQGQATPPAAPEEKHYAEISVPETEADFGTCDWRKEHTAVFKIRNTGQTVLVVHGVETTCGCLEAEYTQEPVRPGGEAEVRLTFKADHPAYFRKTARVRCNTKEQVVVLHVEGDAV